MNRVVATLRAQTLIFDLNRCKRIGIDRPLNDVVMVWCPVYITDEASRNRVAGLVYERPPGQRPQPQVPIEPVRYGLFFIGGPGRRVERAGLAIGIDFFQLSDPSVAHEFAGGAKFACILRAL